MNDLTTCQVKRGKKNRPERFLLTRAPVSPPATKEVGALEDNQRVTYIYSVSLTLSGYLAC
jgi:hypothetical protein